MITREVLRRTVDHLVEGEDASGESLAVLHTIIEHLTDVEIRAAQIYTHVNSSRDETDPEPFLQIREKYRGFYGRTPTETVELHLDMIELITRSLYSTPDRQLSHREIIAIVALFDVHKQLSLQHDVNVTLSLMRDRGDLKFTQGLGLKLVSKFLTKKI